MGHRETRAGREERRLRNAKTRQDRQAKQPPPLSLRRLKEHERAVSKAEALRAAWDLVLAAAAELAPGPSGFKYAGLAFADPADAKAYNAELKAAIETMGEEAEGVIGRWKAWATVALPWIERRKMRPVPIGPEQFPKARVYPSGEVRLVAPTDPDMIALLKRKAGIEDKPAEAVATSTEPASTPLEFHGIPEVSPPAATEPTEPAQPPTQGVDGSA
jgi:hypothetical protein